MKIGIMTVHDASNFGAFLQANSMRMFLEKKGHEVYFIQTNTPKYVRNMYYKLPVTRRSLSHPVEEFQKYLFGRKKWKIFFSARKDFKEIPISEDEKMDIVIIGRDEMWNIKEPIFRNLAYFGCGMKDVTAYGISVGRAEYEDFVEQPEIMEQIKKIKRILARDRKTQEVIEQITGIKPDMVCDPTFLVPVEENTQKISNRYLEKNRFILVYTYPFVMSQTIQNHIVRFARKNNLKIVSAGFFFGWCDYNLNCSPQQFSSVLNKAEYVVTTTFHGTIFSFLNHTKFLTIPFSQKVEDVLEKVGLSNNRVEEECSYEQFEEKILNFKGEYQEVDNRVSVLAKHSEELLVGIK